MPQIKQQNMRIRATDDTPLAIPYLIVSLTILNSIRTKSWKLFGFHAALRMTMLLLSVDSVAASVLLAVVAALRILVSSDLDMLQSWVYTETRDIAWISTAVDADADSRKDNQRARASIFFLSDSSPRREASRETLLTLNLSQSSFKRGGSASTTWSSGRHCRSEVCWWQFSTAQGFLSWHFCRIFDAHNLNFAFFGASFRHHDGSVALLLAIGAPLFTCYFKRLSNTTENSIHKKTYLKYSKFSCKSPFQ